MFNILNRESATPQKKLISFQNFNLVDGLIKSQSKAENHSDSLVVESIITGHYLNDEPLLATAIAANLFNGAKNCIKNTVREIIKIYISQPEYADDTLIPLVEFCDTLANNYWSRLKTTSEGLVELSSIATKYLSEVEKLQEANITYSFWNTDKTDRKTLGAVSLTGLNDIASATESQHRLDYENILHVGLMAILNLWNLGQDENQPTFKNWTVTYQFIDKIVSLCDWPDFEEYKYELIKITKDITFNKADGRSYDGSIPTLSKYLFFGKKTIVTTENAVVLYSEKNQSEKYFTNACRVIHGPGMPATKKPFIILYRDESDTELSNIVEELLKEYPDEFPDPKDSYCVPIFFDGNYYDKRIAWKTM